MIKNISKMFPVAAKIPTTHIYHGSVKLADNFHWLKDQSKEKSNSILDYLKVFF